MTFEYYDIPFRYNETTVKLLFQNPFTLFVYWDISDEDEQKFLNEYGEQAYYYSKLYLRIINETNGNSFEINVDPFAKSWYVNINEPNCRYKAEIFRKINNEYKFVAGSNILTIPTDKPCFNQNSHFRFVDKNTGRKEYIENINHAIKSINSIGSYNELIELELVENEIKNKKTVPYILNNPGSFNNISSGSRYNNNKEDWNARS